MDIGTIVGLIIAVVAIYLSIVLGGGDVAALVDVPSILVVFGGTAGAILVSYPLGALLKLHTVLLKAFFGTPTDAIKTIRDLVRFAEIARRDGILSLESQVESVKDPFIIRGIKMAVDGTDPELIRTILDTELEASIDRHAQGKAILDTIGKMAPAYGMIGTLMGLVFMLQNMQDPSAIGPGMAVALITTLYGALIANMVTGPIAEKLASNDADEVLLKTIVIAGVMSIQSGDNPRVVESKLLTYLPPSKRSLVEQAA